MKRVWKDEDITKALKKMAGTTPDKMVYDRVWFKLEERLENRKKHLLNNVVWRPWGHPIRWVGAAACLCLAFTGVLYQQNSMDQADLAAYVETISNSTSTVTKDLGIVNVSSLVSEAPSESIHQLIISDDDHANSLLNEELSL